MKKKGEEGKGSGARIPLLGLRGLHRLPNQIAIQSHAPDRRNRQSPQSRTGAKLLPPRAIAAHA